jgi:Uma2 family endonuclease
METEVTKKLFTVDEYYRMAEVGILGPEDRVELIDGEIIRMSPIGHRHAAIVAIATKLFNKAFADGAVVAPGSPVRLNDWTEPEPDIVVLKPRKDSYFNNRAGLEDVLFIVEVAETSLRFDQKVKLPRYGVAGIQEVWIVDLQNHVVHVNRDLDGQDYKTSLKLRPGDSVSPLAFPDTRFHVGQLLGTDFE